MDSLNEMIKIRILNVKVEIISNRLKTRDQIKSTDCSKARAFTRRLTRHITHQWIFTSSPRANRLSLTVLLAGIGSAPSC